ncbi:MAG: hypothetical protein K0S41_1480 [Anaerocolumna sp.]|jgi:hypothetical protein|nr:hypothetical protein [Anaerocolumna sp.]
MAVNQCQFPFYLTSYYPTKMIPFKEKKLNSLLYYGKLYVMILIK